jgi:hypothetical protein
MAAEPLIVCRQGGGLWPATPGTAETIARIPNGQMAQITVKRPRSIKWQRRYWSLLSLVAPNTEYDAENLHIRIKIKCGMVREIRERNETVYLVADSTAFDSMDGVAWSLFWDKAINIIISDYMPGITKAAIKAEVEMLCGLPQSAVP